LQNGQNYSVASGLATSAITGSGTGATVNITSVFQSATFATGGNMNTYRYDNKSLKTPSYGWSSWVVVGSGGGAPSYTSGFTAIGGGEPTEYRKDTLGNVQVYGNCSNNSPTNNYCFVLPVGYRPTVPYYFIITEGVYPNNSGPVTYAGYVDTNGHVVVDTNSGGTIDIAFSVTFPTA